MKTNGLTTKDRITTYVAFNLLLTILLTLANGLYAQCSFEEDNLLLSMKTNLHVIDVNLEMENVEFTANYMQENIYLNWVIKGEKEKTFYSIERSSNGKDFSMIYCKNHHNPPSNINLRYSYIDKSPQEHTLYYRLVERTTTGSKKYSPIKTIKIEENIKRKTPINMITQNGKETIKKTVS